MKILASSVGAFAILALPMAFVAQPANTQAAPPSNAQPACGNRQDVVASLGLQYREQQQSVGIVDPNTVLEVFVSQSGTWTIVATDTRGISCIVFFGEGWDSRNAAAEIGA